METAIKEINKIEFNDGELILQQDVEGNYTLCAIGKTAHAYLYKLWKIDPKKYNEIFKRINNCTLAF